MLEAFGLSDPGCIRTNNEDYFMLVAPLDLYLVADGMGGAQAGEHASKLAVETVVDFIVKAGFDLTKPYYGPTEAGLDLCPVGIRGDPIGQVALR